MPETCATPSHAARGRTTRTHGGLAPKRHRRGRPKWPSTTPSVSFGFVRRAGHRSYCVLQAAAPLSVDKQLLTKGSAPNSSRSPRQRRPTSEPRRRRASGVRFEVENASGRREMRPPPSRTVQHGNTLHGRSQSIAVDGSISWATALLQKRPRQKKSAH